MRTYVPPYASPRIPYISEAEVFSRVETAIKTLRALPLGIFLGIKSNWPRELDFHGEAIRLALTPPGTSDKNKKIEKIIKKLRAQDFDDINLDGKTISNMPVQDSRNRPSEEQISDCPIALEWYAKLSRLPENIEQFGVRREEYRIGKRRTSEVDDQIIVTLHALGFSPHMIGIRFGLNEDQTDKRLREIARNLWRIANSTARIVKPGDVAWPSKERVMA